MDAQKVDMFIMMHSKELPPSKLPYIRQQLMMVDESKWGLISAQRKFSGDKHKSWPNEIKNTFHQRLLLEML